MKLLKIGRKKNVVMEMLKIEGEGGKQAIMFFQRKKIILRKSMQNKYIDSYSQKKKKKITQILIPFI